MRARAEDAILSFHVFLSPSSFHDERYKSVIRTGLALNEMGGAEAIRAISAGRTVRARLLEWKRASPSSGSLYMR